MKTKIIILSILAAIAVTTLSSVLPVAIIYQQKNNILSTPLWGTIPAAIAAVLLITVIVIGIITYSQEKSISILTNFEEENKVKIMKMDKREFVKFAMNETDMSPRQALRRYRKIKKAF